MGVEPWTRIALGLTSRRRSRTKRYTVRMTNSENIVVTRQARVTHARRVSTMHAHVRNYTHARIYTGWLQRDTLQKDLINRKREEMTLVR